MQRVNRQALLRHAAGMPPEFAAGRHATATTLGQSGYASEAMQPLLDASVRSMLRSSDAGQGEPAGCDYQEELRRLSAQLLTIQESERRRIAADLHDGIGQSLSLIKLSLESVSQQLAEGQSRAAAQSLRELVAKVKDAMDELHRTTMDMRPSMLDDLGILPTLSWFFREFEAAWRGRRLEKQVGITESDVPGPLKTTIFRILQEAANNILKHADADFIRIDLTRAGDLLQLSIEDNGHGFDPACTSAHSCDGHGFGLLTMQERARATGGTFEMVSAPTRGTRIFIAWRLVAGAAEQGAAQLPCERALAECNKR